MTLKGRVVSLAKSKAITATVFDVLGSLCSVRLSGRGSKLTGIRYEGQKPAIGDTVYIDYSGQAPVAKTKNAAQVDQLIDQAVANVSVTSSANSNSNVTPEVVWNKEHNDLQGIQGGIPVGDAQDVEAWHLSEDEHTDLLSGQSVTMHLHNSVYIRKFEKSTAPTTNDDMDAGYLVNDLWHDSANRKYYLAHDVNTGAADWYYLGSSNLSNGGTIFAVDGVLAAVDVATSPIVITVPTTISSWTMYLEILGTSGSTMLDVIRKRAGVADVSIFNNGVTDNRPVMAWNDADNLLVATPLETDFLAGDVLILSIDTAAVGASSVVLAGAVASGTSDFNLTVEQSGGAPSVSKVGKIIFDGATVADDGGGQVTMKIKPNALTLLEQHTASNSASLDFTTAITLTYDEYLFELIDVLPATNAVQLWQRASVASVFDSNASYHTGGIVFVYNGHATIGNSPSAKVSQITSSNDNDFSNTSIGGVCGFIRLFNPAGVTYKKVDCNIGWIDTLGEAKQGRFMGVFANTSAVDGWRFMFSTGNIASGTIRCYGVAK